ncbi:MAG: YdeI/OmpD-associated family protein [Candidatus Acidiferrales bacterium]
MNAPRFLATIYKIWMLRYVDVPEDVGVALAKEYAAASAKKAGKKSLPKHIPVVATSNIRSTRTTLVPAGAGRYRLQVNAALRKAARADVGEVIGISLKIDLASRELPVPAELEAALKSRPRLKKEFGRLTVAGRMQFLRWFSAKSPEVRRKRLARALEVLTERALLRKPVASKTLRH